MKIYDRKARKSRTKLSRKLVVVVRVMRVFSR